MRRSLRPRPLDKPRGENESKLSRCTPRLDAVTCLLGLNPDPMLVSNLRYYITLWKVSGSFSYKTFLQGIDEEALIWTDD